MGIGDYRLWIEYSIIHYLLFSNPRSMIPLPLLSPATSSPSLTTLLNLKFALKFEIFDSLDVTDSFLFSSFYRFGNNLSSCVFFLPSMSSVSCLRRIIWYNFDCCWLLVVGYWPIKERLICLVLWTKITRLCFRIDLVTRALSGYFTKIIVICNT